MRVLFWGTPEFAVPPLRALIGEGHDVISVVTGPDKPRGRSRSKLDPSPVKVVAMQEGVPVLQPEKPRGDEFMAAMEKLAPDISVVVAYGHILPRVAIDLPRLGTLNIHASLLPALRGAGPIQAAILGGLSETGVTIMQMVPQLDAGPMLHTLRTPIHSDETYGELHDRLTELGALGIVQALAMIDSGVARPITQDDEAATYAPKVDRTMTRLDFSKDADAVSRPAADRRRRQRRAAGRHRACFASGNRARDRRRRPARSMRLGRRAVLWRATQREVASCTARLGTRARRDDRRSLRRAVGTRLSFGA